VAFLHKMILACVSIGMRSIVPTSKQCGPLALMLAGLLIAFTPPASAQAKPNRSGSNLDCMDQAWSAFNKTLYADAIKHSDECIEQFGPEALRSQAELEKQRAPLPPVGAVSSQDTRKIFSRGILNDIATAYFVKGRSAEALLAKTKAPSLKKVMTDAYESAIKLTYGRCWDPQGWFWSPAEAARDQLDRGR
jgi:hypothetical protein